MNLIVGVKKFFLYSQRLELFTELINRRDEKMGAQLLHKPFKMCCSDALLR